GGQRYAEQEQHEPRIEEQPARAEKKQKAQVPPAVSPAAQMGRPASAVGVERGRNFGDAPAGEGRPDDQLARELHARGPEIERHYGLPVEAAQAAVEIDDLPIAENPAAETP